MDIDTNLTPDHVKAAADEAVALVAKLQEILPIDDDLLARDRTVAGCRQAIPTAAIEEAVSILEALGDKGGGFELEEARLALALESELGRVVERLGKLTMRLEGTILKRRSKAVAMTGGLYKGLQGMSRFDGSAIAHVRRLKPHLVRSRRAASDRAAEATPTEAAPASPKP